MAGHDLESKLQQLLDLILRERESTKSFDMETLQAATREKEALLEEMASVQEISPHLKPLATRIKEENRRNAYLCWATLRFIRESMSFFNRNIAVPAYGAGGQMVRGATSGMVLAGRI